MELNNVDTYTASRGRFVLVVDGDPACLSHTSTLLTRLQYKVCPARSAGEAFETASVITPILIVAAQDLGDMPGRELIKKLKTINSTRPVPVIVLSRNSDSQQDRECLAAGAVVCLPARFPVEDLYRVIQMSVEPVPRMNLRINTKLPVTINNRAVDCDGGGCARALSEQGAYIRTSRLYPLKTRLPVEIHLTDTALSAEAEVIYVRNPVDQQTRLQGMGLQFVRISPQDQMRIRRFIREEITRGMR